MTEALTIRRLLDTKGEDFHLTLKAGDTGLDRVVHLPDLNRPSLALAGFTDFFSWDRVQIIGVTELRYLEVLPEDVRDERLQRMFGFDMPCVVVTTSSDVPEYMTTVANDRGIPLMVTSLNTSRFYSVISPFLDLHFAPTMRAHGDLVDVYGMGVLITGDSGVGKSECALELVERSHRLIADDVVVIKRPNATTLIGLSNAMLRHHIEVRGLGIMDVEALFGIGAVRPQAQIDLIIRLEKWSPTKNYDRLGLDNHTANLLGVSVPEYTLPVKPGRNVAILTEVAALNQRLNNANKGTAKLFEQKLSEKIEENRTLLLKDKALNLAPSKPKPNVGQSSGSLQSPFPQTPGSVSGMPPVDTMNEPTQHGFRPQDGASGSDEIVRPLPDEIEISSDPLIEP